MSNFINKKVLPTAIPDEKIVTIYSSDEYAEIVSSLNKPKNIPTKRMSKAQYVDIRTGEIKEYQRHEKSKSVDDLIDAFKKKFKALRRTIRVNFMGNGNEKHITLTYKDRVSDTKLLQKDFRCFWKKFKYHYPNVEYVRVYELQARLSFHIHILIKSKDNEPVNISEDEVSKYWNHKGSVKITSINNVGYISNYFDATTHSKKLQTLPYYPKGLRFYACSAGIVRPQKQTILYKEAKKIVSDMDLTYESESEHYLVNADGVLQKTNRIKYEQFARRRPP